MHWILITMPTDFGLDGWSCCEQCSKLRDTHSGDLLSALLREKLWVQPTELASVNRT